MREWPAKSKSIHAQRTRVIKKPGAFDNDDLKMRSSSDQKKFEAFIAAWEEGPSIKIVAQKLNMSEQTTRSRAAYLRKRGIALKKYPNGLHIDYPALKAFHSSIISSDSKPPPPK